MPASQPIFFRLASSNELAATGTCDLASSTGFASVAVGCGRSFSGHIKHLRQRFGGKQWWLAYVAGCSDAAVSFWESGKRIPASGTLSRIVDALLQAGASPRELATLRRSWLEEKGRRMASRKQKAAGRGGLPNPKPRGTVFQR
jgi:hypothetical protein